ncbi:hypothetical protein ES703_104504 [subsurface metagenome]
MLKRFCDEHELDYQEIDDTLTYGENMEHLKPLVGDYGPDMDRWSAEFDRFLEEERINFLKRYIYATKIGETKTSDVGPPIEPTGGFSLAAYIQSLFGVILTQLLNMGSFLRNTDMLRKREMK